METEVQWLCSEYESLLYLFQKCSFGGVGRRRVRSRIVLMREHTGGDPRGQLVLLLMCFVSWLWRFQVLGVGDGRTSQIRHVSGCCSSGTSNCVPHVSQIARLLGSKLILSISGVYISSHDLVKAEKASGWAKMPSCLRCVM